MNRKNKLLRIKKYVKEIKDYRYLIKNDHKMRLIHIQNKCDCDFVMTCKEGIEEIQSFINESNSKIKIIEKKIFNLSISLYPMKEKYE